MNNLFHKINKEMETLEVRNEATIKQRVVVPLFLEKIGYHASKSVYEKTLGRDSVDIFIDNKMIVETKAHIKFNEEGKGNLDDLVQIIKYLSEHNMEWGILTDGYRYILVNNKIDGDLPYKIVFDISIHKYALHDYVKYFSYENIFVNKKTQFFADIAQFKAYKAKSSPNDKSWVVYQNTLFNFFDFYCEKHNYTTFSSDKHDPLSQIQIDDFFDFINQRIENEIKGRRVTSKETIKNKYSYIFSFFSTLEKYNYIRCHQFHSRNKSLQDYEKTPKIKDHNYLSPERFDKILYHLYNSKNNYRNLAIFILCAYYGFERSEVNDLKWEDINFEKNTMIVNERKCKIVDALCICFKELHKEPKNRNRKQGYVFISPRSKVYKKITTSTINEVFDKLVRISDDSEWEAFSPQYVKSCLIKSMFENGYSIEQIIAEVGIDLTQILNYISMETIRNVGKDRLKKCLKKPVNPFKENIDRFYKNVMA